MNDSQVVSKLLNENGFIPNNSKLPLLIYQAAVVLLVQDPASEFERRFQNFHWAGSWRDKIYPYNHYHSTNHEVLGVYGGIATVLFGGEGGAKFNVRAGDVIIIPVGVAHKCLSASSDFGVVGAYPEGEEVDECLGKANERPRADQNIISVPLPKCDPVFGSEGPLFKYWNLPRT